MTSTTRAALSARDRIAIRYIHEADRLAASQARRLAGLVDPDDLQQEARLALLRAAARLDAGVDPLPYLRRSIAGGLRRYVRDRLRLVRVPRRIHEAGGVPLGHASLDAPITPGGPCHLDTLSAPVPTESGRSLGALAAEALELVDKLPSAEAAALRLTVMEGRSIREAAALLCSPASTIQRKREAAIRSLRCALEV